MEKVRMGVIGLGTIGRLHTRYPAAIEGAELTAVCDAVPAARDKVAAEKGVAAFADHRAMLDSGLVDAVVIATPHWFHPAITMEAFDRGLHVMCEKPVAVHVKDARRMNEAAARRPDLKYAVDFQFRTWPEYRKAKELIDSGELGKMLRLTCIETSWYRTQAYYDSGGWRATWKGEGGGVLINQCPHTFDIVTWLGGMPRRVTALCQRGARHNIEVEDEAAALLEYDRGVFGQIVVSSGEWPGTSLLEIGFEGGLLRIVNGGRSASATLEFHRTRQSVLKHLVTTRVAWERPEVWDIRVPVAKRVEGVGPHQVLFQNFVNAIRMGEPLITPGEEGVKGLEVGNAILLSGLRGKAVDLPLDGDEMEGLIEELKGGK